MKLNLLVLLFVAAIFTSCNNDDDNNFTASAESFVGVYNTTSLNSNGEETFTSNGETTTFVFTDEGSDFDLVWTFTADNTYSVIGSYTSNFSETENGTTETDTEVINVDETGTYVLNLTNDTVALTGGVDFSFDLTTFTENVLEFSSTETETGDDFSDTTTLSVRLVRQ